MDNLYKLLAIEEIKQLKSRYFRCMDTKDWEGLSTVFCADATFDARAALSIGGHAAEGPAAASNDWITRGGAAIVAFISGAIGDDITCHHGHCHEIEILSEAEARGVIAMEDQIFEPEAAGLALKLHGCGHYHETYKKVDGAWRIHTSRLSRLYVRLG